MNPAQPKAPQTPRPEHQTRTEGFSDHKLRSQDPSEGNYRDIEDEDDKEE